MVAGSFTEGKLCKIVDQINNTGITKYKINMQYITYHAPHVRWILQKGKEVNS